MPATEFSPSIPSRPLYGTLTPNGSAPAIMVADGEGALALADLAARAPAAMAHATVIYLAGPADHAHGLAALGETAFEVACDLPHALSLLDAALERATMATRLYLAGSEGMIGRVSARAIEAGILPEAIQAEHRGPITRAVQCVHCKTVAEHVATDPYTCPGCRRTLYVRDHYSRRLGVFQGVCVDAETPGDIPETRELTA